MIRLDVSRYNQLLRKVPARQRGEPASCRHVYEMPPTRTSDDRCAFLELSHSLGARRFRASQLAEEFSIPAHIKELNDAEAVEWQLIELSTVGKSFRCLHVVLHLV